MANLPQLEFINNTGPGQFERRERQIVRSAAAKHGHRIGPRAPRRKRQLERNTALTTRLNQSQIERKEQNGGYPESEKSTAPDLEQEQLHLFNLSCAETRTHLVQNSMSLPYVGAGKQCPFDSYPVTWHTCYQKLIDFWYYSVVPRSQALLKATPLQMSEYTTWSLQLDMSEPSLFYTSLFLASGIPVVEGWLSIETARWLRLQAVRTLNEALSDPNRAISNAVIIAVGRIALHEHVYGNRWVAHNVHRPAQQWMLALRGGIIKLQLPAITMQLMVWADTLMAAESGTEAYFSDLPDTAQVKSYENAEAIAVVEHCSPNRTNHPDFDEQSIATGEAKG